MIYGQRFRFLLKEKLLLSKKKKNDVCEGKGQRAHGGCVQKEKREREVKKRDSPQAQDHQEKWGERLMNLPCTWTERKKKEKKKGVGELATR